MPKIKTMPLPFHTNLNGCERVNRAFARKAWSWGLPVRLDSGRGAVLLRKPDSVPEQDAKAQFDEACLAAMGLQAGTPLTDAMKRKCAYLIPWGRTALHFEFTNKSNPFVKYGEAVELMPELYAWSKRWCIEPLPGTSDAVANFRLTEKDPGAGSFSPCVP